MRTIYKYYVLPYAKNTIQMPAGRKILNVGYDLESRICIWALVDTEAELRANTVMTIGTGWDFGLMEADCGVSMKDFDYVGTVKSEYIWHYFIKEEKKEN